MRDHVLKFTHALGFSKLFRDFIYSPEALSGFFDKGKAEKRAGMIAERYQYRASAIEILTRQNLQWQAPAPVMESIARLGRKDAVAVLTGQQAGLFGGPYLIIFKALAAVKLAQRLEAELSVPVIPIFWIASEDHDLREVSAVDIFDAAGSLTRLNIDYDPGRKYPPVGALTYDRSISREVKNLQANLPENDFRAEAVKRITEIYQPGRSMVDCYAEYVLSLVGRFGPVLFNPHDVPYKQLTVPVMRDIVRRYSEIKNILKTSSSRLTSDGYHVQVEKTESAAHLFCHAPERTALHYKDGEFMAGDMTLSENGLIKEIAGRPLDFSPDVLTRPILQSSFFPTAAVIAGPAEIAYFAQIMELFDAFELIRPQVVARPSMTMVEKRFQTLMDRHRIAFEALAGDVESIINAVLQTSYPEEFDLCLADMAAGAERHFKTLKEKLPALDPGLMEVAGRAEERIESILEGLRKKMFAAHRRKNEIERDRIYRLMDHLYPRRGLAERAIAPVYFMSRYGEGIIDFIYENMHLDETGHRLLMLSEYNG